LEIVCSWASSSSHSHWQCYFPLFFFLFYFFSLRDKLNQFPF
jgi:hypothetical protein